MIRCVCDMMAMHMADFFFFFKFVGRQKVVNSVRREKLALQGLCGIRHGSFSCLFSQ
jgi:hypothetical protein